MITDNDNNNNVNNNNNNIDMKLAICFRRYRGGKWEADNSRISLCTYMKFSPPLDGT